MSLSDSIPNGGIGNADRPVSGNHPVPTPVRQSVALEIKLAEWNPEKDLLAMVTEESKIVLHRFNWQRLWITYLGKPITAICWRPDGKVPAIGLED